MQTNSKNEVPESKDLSPKAFWKEILRGILQIAFFVLVAVLVNKFLFYTPHVSGPSMEDSFHDGDLLFCTRVYNGTVVERYDAVTIWWEEQNMQIVKRVYGLPGEVISVNRNGAICINGEEIEDPYGKEPMEAKGILEKPVTLGEKEFFVLGDNRNHSDDSRFQVGIVKFQDILGKVLFKIW